MSPRKALDGAVRRRMYLFRHGDVSYVGPDGVHVGDARMVPLNDRGRREADGMSELTAHVRFDRAACSGLPRSRETAERILGGRDLTVANIPALEEIRHGTELDEQNFDVLGDIAYGCRTVTDEGARLLGGETFAGFRDRVVASIDEVVATADWHDLLLVCHGGTNAVVLGWAMGVGLEAVRAIEQDTCCLNVIDFDTGPDGEVLRTYLRAINVTAYDPIKADINHTAWERIAAELL